MVKMHIVPEEDWKVIGKYLDAAGIVLIPQVALDELGEDEAAKLRSLEGEVFYDFGGEAQVWVDVVDGEGHYALGELLDQ